MTELLRSPKRRHSVRGPYGVISIAGLVFGREAVTEQITAQVQGLVGEEAANMINHTVENASKPASSVPALALGVLVLLLGASGVFGQLQDALNTIWGS
jgi:membrane protein